jgi:hypothetical protein
MGSGQRGPDAPVQCSRSADQAAKQTREPVMKKESGTTGASGQAPGQARRSLWIVVD